MSRTLQVGAYTATVTVPRPKAREVVRLAVEWSPHVPLDLSREELDSYRRARNLALVDLLDEFDIGVAVDDL